MFGSDVARLPDRKPQVTTGGRVSGTYTQEVVVRRLFGRGRGSRSRVAEVMRATIVAPRGAPGDSLLAIGHHAGMGVSHLVVTTDGHEWTLVGHPLGGTHPKPRQAWHALHQIDDPFAWPLGAALDVMLGDGYATVRGVWHGRTVDIKVGQWNTDAANRWDRLAPLVDPYRRHPSSFGLPAHRTKRERKPRWGVDLKDQNLEPCALCAGDVPAAGDGQRSG